MVLGSGAFGRCLGHEIGTLTNEISILIKETSEIPHLFHHVRTQRKVSSRNAEEGFLQNPTMLAP